MSNDGRIRTPKGDAFLARYGSTSMAELLKQPEVREIVRKYREKLPDLDRTDEQIIDAYARYLASKPREVRS